MEKIIHDLYDFNPMASLHASIIVRMGEEVGESAKPCCTISAEETTRLTEELLAKAALAIGKCNEEAINGNDNAVAKYRGIAEGLCYAASEVSGTSFKCAYNLALALYKHI